MKIKKLDLNGVFEIQLEPIEDERGFFMRTYDNKIFEDYELNINWPQESHSFNKKRDTIRGFHFQFAPYTESKIVRSVRGEFFFCFVDLRKKSSNLGKWASINLYENKNALYIPEGFASGFCTLEDNCNILYKMSKSFNAESYGGIRWNDPDLRIKWPLKEKAIVTEKDSNSQTFKEFIKKYGGL